MRILNAMTACCALTVLMVGPAKAENWHISFNHTGYAPTEIIADIERDGDDLSLAAPGFDLQFTCDGEICESQTTGGNIVTMNLDADQITGSVSAGLLGGDLAAVPTDQSLSDVLRDYSSIAEEVIVALNENAFDPAQLETEAFLQFTASFRNQAANSHNDLEFLRAMRNTWEEAHPFSHVVLSRADAPVPALVDFLDGMNVGFEAARLTWQGDVAILTVDTMMGNDTIEQIEAAYDAIAERGASGLIIDLRANGGGAFAVKPLVEHVIDEPSDVGYFLSRRWTEHNDENPTLERVQQEEPWTGWSIRSFWADVLERGIVRIRMEPAANNYDGPIIVLTSNTTASAAEMAADALKGSGVTTLVGEQTAGEMLSQTMFDLSGGFQLALPIADYVSVAHGRVEGAGVTPHIVTSAGEAMDVALQMLAD